MTNSEAIQILKQYLDMDSEVMSEYLEAQRMAIKALTELKNYQKARNEINQKIINQKIINQETIDWDYIEDGKVIGLSLAESIIAHYVDGGDENDK